MVNTLSQNPDLVLFVAAAFIGGVVGKLLKIPGGTLLGATAVVAATGIYFDLDHTPPSMMLFLVQILIGCMLGQSINRRFWQNFLQIWRPALMVVGIYTLLAVPFAVFLVWTFGFDVLTAVLATTPARMQDMIILAGTLNSDAITVMLMQLSRQFVVIGITPFFLTKFSMKEGNISSKTQGEKRKDPLFSGFYQADIKAYAILLVPAVIGSILGQATGHVLGALLGAFCAVAASRLIWIHAGEVPFPKPFGFIIQCLAGILLGARVTPEIGGLILNQVAPLISTCLYVCVGGLFVSWLLHRRYHWDRGLSWLASAPGRTGDILAMSQDLDLSDHDRLALASVHTVRQAYFTLLISVAMVFF